MRWWDGRAWGPPAHAPAPATERPVKITPPVASQLATWLGLFASLAAALVAAIAVLAVGLVLTGSLDPDADTVADLPPGLVVALLVASSVAMWAVYTLAFDFARRRNRLSFADAVGWSRLARMTAIGLGVGVLLRWPLAALELALVGEDQPTELAGLDLTGLGVVGLVLLALAVTVGAPVFEELFFRGLMLPTLSRSWPVWAAVVVSSVIFGVLHVGQPVLAIAYITLVGAVLAVVRIRTRSLVPCVVAHAVFNATSVLMALTLG